MAGDRLSRDFSIHVGAVSADGDEVLELCCQSLPGFTREHYLKYFVQNPLGPPAFVVARDAAGAMVGTAGLHPAEMLVDGEARPVGIAGDFVVADGLRGWGPAVALQRRLLPLLEIRGWDFAYGLPNPAAQAVLKRVGYRELGAFTRLERRIRARERVSLVIGSGFGRRDRVRRCSVETTPRFDDRFEELWSARPRANYVPYRTTSHLNWRYELDRGTLSRFSLSVAVTDGGVAAFSVSHVSYGVRRVVDLGWLDDASLRAVLRFDLARAARSRLAGVDLLHLGLRDALPEVLAPLGFVAAPAAPVIAYSPGGGGAAFTDPERWDLFEGAFDV